MMMRLQRPGLVRRWLRHTTTVLALLALGACAELQKDDDEAPAPVSTTDLTIAGSIGDGPVIGADITVTDANGEVVAELQSDGEARFTVDIPDGTPFPVTVTGNGGTDLVTGAPADFTFESVLFSGTGPTTVNVSPYTTLAVELARCSDDLSEAGLNRAWNTLTDSLDLAWDNDALQDPMLSPVTADNIATTVLSNEALGEALRRTRQALANSGAPETADTTEIDILRAMACDLGDGELDGSGTAPARIGATLQTVLNNVRTEVIAGALRVNGQDATVLMDQAIAQVQPDSSQRVADVAVEASLIDDAVAGFIVTAGTLDDPVNDLILETLAASDNGSARAALANALDAATLADLDSLVTQISLADEPTIMEIKNRQEQAGNASMPSLSFDSNRQTVEPGERVTLSWASLDAERCFAGGDWNGRQQLDGANVSRRLNRTSTFSLSCSGLGGTTDREVTVTVAGTEPEPEPEPTVSLSASSTSVEFGGSVTLSWSSTNADSCSASGGWSGSRQTSGSQSVGPLSDDASFTLTCTGAGGDATSTVAVTVGDEPATPPTANLSASATAVDWGETITLSWTSNHANQCAAGGGWDGNLATSGQRQIGPLTNDSTFTLECFGAGGSATDSVVISVGEPPAEAPTVSLSSSASSVDSGESVTLSWQSANASQCTASGAWSGSLSTNGSQQVGPLSSDATFSINCTGDGGQASDSVSVTVNEEEPADPPTANLSASVDVVGSGETLTLSWSSTNASSCTASGGWSGNLSTSGEQVVGPFSQATSFTLRCTGDGGEVVDMVSVQVIGEINLSWAAPDENTDGSNLDDLTGYRIYYGTSSGNYGDPVTVVGANTTQTTLEVASGEYFIVMTATNAAGSESEYSNEISRTVP